MKKTTIAVSFLVGVFVAAFVYQVYVNWQFQKAFTGDHATLTQVVEFINKSIATNQPATEKK